MSRKKGQFFGLYLMDWIIVLTVLAILIIIGLVVKESL